MNIAGKSVCFAQLFYAVNSQPPILMMLRSQCDSITVRFSAYFKFFIGLLPVNPVGIIPVFISMTSYQPAAVRNKTNLTANLSVAIILLTSLFLGDGILQIFGISIDSFRIAGGIRW